MFVGFAWAKRRAFALGACGLFALACSASHHDCYETRDCPETDAPIDIGSSDDWWHTGSGGQTNEPAGADPSAAGAAGSSPSDDGGSPSESQVPQVLRISPSDGARGITQDSPIVIRFSRPMDAEATEAAYESNDLPAAQLTFSWDDAGTTLTLSPRVPLRYAPSPDKQTYHYGFGARAKDQHGRSLEACHFTFSTLRQVSVVLLAETERTGNWTEGEAEGIHNCLRAPKAGYDPTVCVGDDLNNVRYTGFLSFDFSPLPDDIAQFPSARLLASALVHGTPEALGASRLEHLAYGDLNEAALTVAPSAAPNPLFVAATLADQAQLELNLDVTAALADDYARRVASANRSQFRLGFAKVSANAHWDDVEFPTSSIRLALSYLVP